jgi:hypothetical protein
MAKATSELASTPSQTQPSLSIKKPTAKKKKAPTHYIFRLVEEHPKYYEGASAYPPRFVIPNNDMIVYNYGTEENPDFRPRQIRYIDGYPTIFVDEQEKNGPVPENILSSQKNIITFEFGNLTVPAWNKTLYEFLMLSNQCQQNTNKSRQTKNVYRLLDFYNSDNNAVEIGKKKDMAYDMARNASVEDMIPHAKFLGISFIHPATGEERDYDVIREDYKAKALENPDNFMLFANNPRVKILYIVEQGLKNNVITTELVKGQLHWSGSKQLIATLDASQPEKEAIADFASTDEGASFVKTLKVQLSM